MKLRDFFYLHKSDREVILLILGVAAIACVLLFFTGHGVEDGMVSKDDTVNLRKSPISSYPFGLEASQGGVTSEALQKELFPFDPNTADSTQFHRLGLPSHIVRNIYKYRAAGGVFRKKTDFARLYGLTVKDYRRLEPYIRISSDYQPAASLVAEEKESRRDTLRYPVKVTEGEYVDLSTADTTALRKVPGIGVYYARRIRQYGERLGGYVSIDQLDEIEDFPASAKKYLVVGTPHVRTLAINHLSLNELRRHPYINYYMARAIVDYRRLHGPVHSLQDLSLLPEFTPELIKRLTPYLDFSS